MSRIVALCYLRLSDRDVKEISIEIQRDACNEICRRFGWMPDFFEEGENTRGQFSAQKRTNLEKWVELYARALSDPTVAAIVAYDHQRVFRRTSAALFCAEELAPLGIKLMFAADGEFAINSPEAKFQATMKAGMSEYESLKVSARLRAHYAKVKETQGYAGHKYMFGLDRSGNSSHELVRWTPDENFPHVLRILELYQKGWMGTNTIADILAAEGIMWRNQSDQPSRILPDTVRRLLYRLDLYAPHLPPELVKRVSEVRAQRARHKSNHAVMRHPPALLRGVLYCAECLTKFRQTIIPKGKDRTLVAYYSHSAIGGCRLHPRYQKQRKVNALFVQQLEYLEQWGTDDLASLLAPETPLPPAIDYAPELAKLDRRQERYEEMLADNNIALDRYVPAIAKIQARREEIKTLQKIELPRPPSSRLSPDEWANEIKGIHALLVPLIDQDPQQANDVAQEMFSQVLWANGIVEIYDAFGGRLPIYR